jgi:hypothetical protein
VNPADSTLALVIIGVLAIGPHALWAAMLLTGRWKITTPSRPSPPPAEPAAAADVEQAAAAADPHLEVAA